MLSACLFLWDIMWKADQPSHQGEWRIKVCCYTPSHIAFAVRLCNYIHDISHTSPTHRCISGRKCPCDTTSYPCVQCAGNPCPTGVLAPDRAFPQDPVIRVYSHHRRPFAYAHLYNFIGWSTMHTSHLYNSLTLAVLITQAHPCTYLHIPARELFAAGVLDARDKRQRNEFSERNNIPGMPELPKGYMFTQWMRCADIVQSCIAVRLVTVMCMCDHMVGSVSRVTTYPQEVHPPGQAAEFRCKRGWAARFDARCHGATRLAVRTSSCPPHISIWCHRLSSVHRSSVVRMRVFEYVLHAHFPCPGRQSAISTS